VDVDDVGRANKIQCRQTRIAQGEGEPGVAERRSVPVDPELANQLGFSGSDVRVAHRRRLDDERVIGGFFSDEHPVIDAGASEGLMLTECGTGGSALAIVRAD